MRLRELKERSVNWWTAGLLLTALLTLASIALVVLSGTGRLPFGYLEPEPVTLAADDVIDGSLTFDRSSYLAGEPVHYQLRLLWRDAEVTPNLETLASGVGFFPFTHHSTKTTSRRLGGGVREFVIDFFLLAVNVDMPASYQLDSASVHYSRLSEENGGLHALRLQPPRVYIGEYYPGEITDIELRPAKPRIDDVPGSRRALPALNAVALLAAGLYLLWSRGRRRPRKELSAAELLWRELAELRIHGPGNKPYIAALEPLLTRAAELRTGMTRRRFWSGAAAAADDAMLIESRELLTNAYGPVPPAAEVAERLDEITDALLAPMLASDRLQREMLASPAERLRQQPAVLAGGSALLLAALLMFGLATVPAAWLTADIRDYNKAVTSLERGTDLREVLQEFSDIADAADDPRVKAAAFYNLGSLLVNPSLSRMSREQRRNLLQAIFHTDISLDLLLHDLELDAEFELITLLSETTRQYVQAEQALRAAITAGPHDGDMGRNLELLAKTRRAIARSLARLIEKGVDDGGSQEALSQTVIDLKVLMETELPDDYARLDEGKDDRNYFIMERF